METIIRQFFEKHALVAVVEECDNDAFLHAHPEMQCFAVKVTGPTGIIASAYACNMRLPSGWKSGLYWYLWSIHNDITTVIEYDTFEHWSQGNWKHTLEAIGMNTAQEWFDVMKANERAMREALGAALFLEFYGLDSNEV